MSRTLDYRPEIDGLRAVAILAVVAFHIAPQLLPGGFLGVDVFFVVSGYLIASLILRQIGDGTFRFREFWVRRVRRLVPALIAMILVVALVGHFLQLQPERGQLARQSLSAMFSFANVMLWQDTSGYWGTSSDNLALLHTWSLSLEEQFYLLFPLTLVLVHRFFRRYLLMLAIVFCVAGFALCVWGTARYPAASFYLLPTRMWELGIGVALAMVPGTPGACPAPRQWHGAAVLAGLAMIGLSCVLIDGGKQIPGPWPLPACLGAALVLQYGASPSFARRALTVAPVRYIGLISYSLYLWHWPTVVFDSYLETGRNLLVVVPVMVVASVASYHWLERPFRRGFPHSMKALGGLVVVALLAVIPVALTSGCPTLPDGLKHHDPSEHSDSRFEGRDILTHGQPPMIFGDATPGTPRVALVGSSHGVAIAPAFHDYSADGRCQLLMVVSSAVGVTTRNRELHSEEIRTNRLRQLQEFQPDVIVVVGAWSFECGSKHFREDLEQRLLEYAAIAKRVLVLSQVPRFGLPERYEREMRKFLVASLRGGGWPVVQPHDTVPRANRLVSDLVRGLSRPAIGFLPIHGALLNPDGSIRYRHDGHILYADRHHVSGRGGRFVFEQAIREPLEAAIAATRSE